MQSISYFSKIADGFNSVASVETSYFHATSLPCIIRSLVWKK